jgi:hypothetical protein
VQDVKEQFAGWLVSGLSKVNRLLNAGEQLGAENRDLFTNW